MVYEAPSREGERRRLYLVDRLAGKVSKEDANYRPAENEGTTKESCAECEHYLQPGHETSSCRRTAGIVEAKDICDLFVPRENENSGQSGVNITINIGAK